MLLLAIPFVHCKSLKPFKEDKVIESIIKRSIDENQLRGIVLLNLVPSQCCKGQDFIVKLEEIKRHITRSTTATILNINKYYHPSVDRYLANVSIPFPYSSTPVIKPNFLANDRVILVITFDAGWLSRDAELDRTVRRYQWLFSSTQAVSRTLLMSIVQKKTVFRSAELLQQVNDDGSTYCNADLLEILMIHKGSDCKYTVYQFNPFLKGSFNSSEYSAKTKFFNSLSENLHKHEFKIMHTHGYHLGLKRFDYVWSSVQVVYPIGTCLNKLNGTVRTYSQEEWEGYSFCDFTSLTTHETKLDYINTKIAATNPRTVYFLAPALYETKESIDHVSIVLNLIATAAIIAIFWFSSVWFEFDSLAWHPIMIFSMIIGVGNPRNQVKIAESICLFCLFSVGFFAGSHLLSGITDAKVTRGEEKRLSTIDDLAKNNLTLVFLYFVTRLNDFTGIDTHFDASLEQNRHYKDLLMFKNISLSLMPMEVMGLMFPDRITSNGVVLARKSNIVHCSLGCDWIVKRRNNPILHSLSYLLMRFYESGLDSASKQEMVKENKYDIKVNTHKLYRTRVEDAIIEAILEIDQMALNSNDESIAFNLWLMLGVCYLSMLSALAVEILIMSRSKK